MIRNSSIDEWMVLIQFTSEDPANELILDHVMKGFPQLTSLLYVINNKANDTIYDLDIHCFAGREFINEEMEGLKPFRVMCRKRNVCEC